MGCCFCLKKRPAMISKFSCALLFSACSLLSGCLVPEKFDASIRFDSDDTYVYRYAGTVANGQALMDLKQKGTLASEDEEKLKAFVTQVKEEDPRVQEIEYQGNARYALKYEETLPIGKKSRLIPLVKVLHGKGGTIVVSSPKFAEKDQALLEDIGVKVDGTLEVRLPAGAEVVEQNADRTPGWFSRTYAWKIGEAGKAPRIEFRMPGSDH